MAAALELLSIDGDGYVVVSDNGEWDPSDIVIHYKKLDEEDPAMTSSRQTTLVYCTM